MKKSQQFAKWEKQIGKARRSDRCQKGRTAGLLSSSFPSNKSEPTNFSGIFSFGCLVALQVKICPPATQKNHFRDNNFLSKKVKNS